MSYLSKCAIYPQKVASTRGGLITFKHGYPTEILQLGVNIIINIKNVILRKPYKVMERVLNS